MSTEMQRIAIVTGGGSGIGAAVAHALAGDGWIVVLAGRRREALEAVAAAGSGLTGKLDAIPTDVTHETSVRNLFETTVQRYSRVDLLFNNAGIGAISPLPSTLSTSVSARWSFGRKSWNDSGPGDADWRGLAWFGDGRYLLFPDIPNNRMLC